MEGNNGKENEKCEKELKEIVKWMEDGRKNVKWCIKEGVKEIWKDVCSGEYNVIKEKIKKKF